MRFKKDIDKREQIESGDHVVSTVICLSRFLIVLTHSNPKGAGREKTYPQ